ncbi:LacI family DNA-binding transcriptional regulator [Phyllobacterium chamaecytisi]|uniref:LacI family DNA-binding transcriptional regulator n=1 Tax=Phyllobacterium chamaecytisi TaxID=2876082 RepID=UPI001CCEAC34|nr:LacI family DNA-binding transcriptional regulator [Phyllobacterium sp. KW56]MBZ9603293.1 LacI family DNA-binding transcriptional regulator [Phyllobacterium sp. KW56]
MASKLPVSLKDIAEAAGVSTITVSRALRGLPLVKPDTRKQITEIANRLGYVPNQVASSLRSRKTGLIAVIVPTVAGSIFSDTVNSISNELGKAGYQIIIGESSYDIDQEQAVLEALVQRRPDGVIIAGVNHTRTSRELLALMNVPVVEIWDMTDDPVDSVVGFSNRGAAYQFTLALIEKGYRKFAIASGPMEHRNRAQQRAVGHCEALAEKGLSSFGSIVIPHFMGMLSSGETLLKFVTDTSDVDCLFCTNELIAIGATVQCRRAGMRIPDDIAIVGFGNVEAALIIDPPLTTVTIHGAEMGREAARIVFECLSGKRDGHVSIDVGYTITWRGTA